MTRSNTRRRTEARDAKWVIRFVVSAFLAGLLLSGPAFAFEPTALASSTTVRELSTTVPSGVTGGSSLPVLYLYERPTPSAAGMTPGLMLYGGRAALGGDQLSLTSGVYFGRTLQLADMLQAHGSAFAGAPGILGMAAAASDRQQALQGGRALAQSLSYRSGALNVTGSYTSVDASFQGLNKLVASQPELAGLKNQLGMDKLDLQATFQPTKALGLRATYNQLVNDQPGNNQRGLTQTKMHYDLAYALSGNTNLTAAYDSLEKALAQASGATVSGTRTTSLSLAHKFSDTTLLRFGQQRISALQNGTTLDTTINSLHFETKPSAALGLVSDITRKTMSNGTVDNTTALNLSSAFGSGASAMRLTGQWMQHVTGQDGAQNDRLTTLSLNSTANPLMQLAMNYTRQQSDGPTKKDYTKTSAVVTSRLAKSATITTTLVNESDLGRSLASQQTVKLDFTPSLLQLNSQYHTVKRGDGQDEVEMANNLFLPAGRKMRDWARQASKQSLFTGVERYGVAGLAGWAQMPEGGVTYQMIRRDQSNKGTANTKRLGYQTMLGRNAYLRLAEQQYPVKKDGDKTTLLPIHERTLEAGLRLGGRFSLLARQLNHRDLPDVDSTGLATVGRVSTSLLALRGAMGKGDRFSFAGGVQRNQADDPSRSARMAFADLHAKIGAPLAQWAKEASNKGVFDDHATYGHRDLPGWAQLSDGGLHLQFVNRASGQTGPAQTTYLAGGQMMVGRRLYLKAGMQQNPLNDQNQVVPGRRMLYEVGTQLGKFTALARQISEHDDAAHSISQSSYFGLRSRLSQRERLEALLVLDKVGQLSGDYSRTSYGLEYAREVDADHYLTFKGTITQDGNPTLAAGSGKSFRFDLGYKQDW